MVREELGAYKPFVLFALNDRYILIKLSHKPLNGDNDDDLDGRLLVRGGPLRSQGDNFGELVLPLPYVPKIDRKRRFHKRDRAKVPVTNY